MKVKLFILFLCFLSPITIFLHGMAPAIPAARPAIHEAARIGDLQTVQQIINKNANSVNQQDNGGWSPLHYATICGHEAVARLLLKHGASVYLQDKAGRTPLSLAHGIKGAHIVEQWPQILQQYASARLAFCEVLHPRLSTYSQARTLAPHLIPDILQHLQPCDFEVANRQSTITKTYSVFANPHAQLALATTFAVAFGMWQLLNR